MGVYRANYSKSLGDGKKWVFKPQEDWVFIKVEPIVSEEVWKECNAILDDQEKRNRRPAKKTLHLFTGFAYCECGDKMYVPSDSLKYVCYKCRNKIGIADLEEIFHTQLQSFFMSPTEISGYLAQADHVIKEKEELLGALEEEKKRTEKNRDRVFRSYLDEEIDVKTYGAQFRPMEERVRQIDDQIPELQGEIDFLRIQFLSSDRVLLEARDLYSRWPQLAEEEKRQIVENITDKILVGKEDISINLCYLPIGSEKAADRQRNHRGSSRPPA